MAADALQTYYGGNGNSGTGPAGGAGRRLQSGKGAGKSWEVGINKLPPSDINWVDACTWTPRTQEYMQEVEPLSPNGGYKDRRVVQDTSTNPPTTYEIFFPYGPQSHPDQLGINVGGWDHNLEVCAYAVSYTHLTLPTILLV